MIKHSAKLVVDIVISGKQKRFREETTWGLIWAAILCLFLSSDAVNKMEHSHYICYVCSTHHTESHCKEALCVGVNAVQNIEQKLEDLSRTDTVMVCLLKSLRQCSLMTSQSVGQSVCVV